MLPRVRSFVRAVFARRQFEHEIDEEVQLHLELYTQDLIASGLAPLEAVRRARIEFGSVQNVRVDCREARGLRLLNELTRNVRYAARTLRRTPAFTISVLTTLALCIGSTLTIFAVVDSVLLRPLPFPNADDLVSIYNTYPNADVPNDGCSLTNYYERRGQLPAFAGLSAYRHGSAVVGEVGSAEREDVTRVTADFFATLGVAPVVGRAFVEAETAYATSSVVVISDTYWRHRLNAVSDVIGRRVRVDGRERTIVGVLPAGFSFLSSTAALYFPLASDPEERSPGQRHSGNSDMVARLRPGTTRAQAQAQIDAHNAALEATNPDAPRMAAAGFRSVVVSLHADHVGSVRNILLLLQAGVLVLLVIGAVNVTNLFLIRASGRTKEVAVRRAIGAARIQVVREVLTESTLVAVAGGAAGLALGAWGINLLRLLGAEHLPLGVRLAFDARLALAGMLGSLALGAVIAAPSAWYHLRLESGRLLKLDIRGATPSRAVRRMRHGFVIAQIALAFVLVAGAGLLSVSLRQVLEVLPGFRPDNLLTGQMTLPGRNYPDRAALLAFAERLVTTFDRQPGVTAAGLATNIPLSGIDSKTAVTVRGFSLPAGVSPRGHYSYSVDGDYFKAMGYTLREGRFLTSEDSRVPVRSCVVDHDFAQYYWPGGSAIGHEVFEGGRERPLSEAFRIVGVVEPVKQSGLTDAAAQGAIYYPFGHRPDRSVFVLARTATAPETMSSTLRGLARKLDPQVPVNDVRTMSDRLAASLVTRRSPAVLAGALSGITLLLAALGTYGVLAFAAAERRREIALRMALGAAPARIRHEFIRLTIWLVGAGTIAGVTGAWLTGRSMRSVLYNVPAVHWPTLGLTAAVIALCAILACLLPARRAGRISPLEALSE
ncbi:ABC transporter permease [soil metagenome]